MAFSPGILYGIIGPNGSGKSTLLKTMTGVWKPTEGKVFWQDEELLKKERTEISKVVSLVPQTPMIHFDFSVEDIVSMGRYPHGKSVGARVDIIEWALRIVDVLHLRHRKITQVSSGERQRVYIARALVTESPVLLLDEPTTNLDIRHKSDIWKLLRMLVDQGKIVVVTNHDLRVTEKFCDEVALLNQGRCVRQGSFGEVLTQDVIEEVFGVSTLEV